MIANLQAANQPTDQPANQRKMSHQEVTRLAEALRNVAELHRNRVGSLEATGAVVIRALVTNIVDELEVQYYNDSARELADRARAIINEQVEAQLQRLYSGQEV